MTNEPIDAEVMPAEKMAVAVREQIGAMAPSGLFGSVGPVEVIAKATAVATALKDVLRAQKLISTISGREYPKCEAWTLLGTMLGVFPVLEWCRQVEGGWEARVAARTKDGAIVGAAEAQCLKTEKNWSNRDDFALRSMAQTRATAKCLRMPLGFVMTLAGYEATPAEEMDHPKSQPPPGHPRGGQTPPRRPATQPRPSAAPAPAHKTVPYADENTRGRMLRKFENLKLLGEFFVKIGWLLPNSETAEDLPLQYVPITQKQADTLESCFKNFEAGGDAVAPYPPNPVKPPPPNVPQKQKPVEVPRDPNPDPNSPTAPWRAFPVPYGKHAGTKLADLDKKVLYGFWANMEVETEYQGRPRKPEQIARDQTFRLYLDEAGQHYEFTKRDEDGPAMSTPTPDSKYEPAEPEEDDVPF